MNEKFWNPKNIYILNETSSRSNFTALIEYNV